MTPYTSQMVNRARKHVAAGWSLRQTANLLRSEFGRRPSHATVHEWVNEDRSERSRAYKRTVYRDGYRRERLDKQMRELYRRGLSLNAIVVVAELYMDEHLSERQVRSRLGLRSGEVVARRST